MALIQLEVRTLIFSSMCLILFTALSMLYYKLNQKTYAGFGCWIISSFCFDVGLYCFMFLSEISALVSLERPYLFPRRCCHAFRRYYPVRPVGSSGPNVIISRIFFTF
jgi:hypothetical protein